jgi:hypothetical protein
MYNKFSVSVSKFHHLALCAVLALSLAGCGANDATSTAAQTSSTGTTSTTTSAAVQPFLLHGVPMATVEAGSVYQYTPSTTGSNGRVLSYDIVNKPEWATFVEATGVLSGTPDGTNVGTSGEIEIGVSDGSTRATVGPFRIRVIPQELRTDPVAPTPPAAPTITGTPASSVIAGQPYSFTPVVTNPTAAVLSFSIVNRPTWATFNTATGSLSGTPTTANAGTFANIVISVSTAAAPISLPAFSIEVQPAADNSPTISGTPATKVAGGADYSFKPVAGDPDGNALTFSILNAPSWANFNTHTGQLSGTAPSSTTASLFSNIVISVSDGTLSASLPSFSIAVQATSGSTGPTGGGKIKFHPGQYVELDAGSGGGGLTGWLATIASLQGAQGVKGVMLIQPWSSLEFAENVYTQGSGSSAQGFAMIDQLLAACKNAGLQFILGYEDRAFGGPQTFSSPTSYGQLPSYFDTLENGNPGYLDAPSGTTFQGEGLQMIADVTNPLVTARAIALVTAYGNRYDSNPNFEMFRTPETANAAFTGSGQDDQYVTQLQAWMAGARAAFPNTGLSVSANFLSTPEQFTALFATAITYSIGMGGPDTWPNFTTFDGTSNLVFNGQYGGTNYRGKLPWISEVQQPDENGVVSPSPLATYNFAMTGDPTTGGSMNSNYIIWAFDANWQGPNAFTNGQILNFIASVNGAVNTKAPSTY